MANQHQTSPRPSLPIARTRRASPEASRDALCNLGKPDANSCTAADHHETFTRMVRVLSDACAPMRFVDQCRGTVIAVVWMVGGGGQPAAGRVRRVIKEKFL